ncbi:MAG: IclR family transcriptional regulator [bacterium]|nr:IclR family transcriptional regulator [bacterium]MDT8365458.1 IclR family transcriptional regulator [bacterium]
MEKVRNSDLVGDTRPAVPKVDTVVRALEILECFTTGEPEQTLKQLCEKTGLYKSRVHRLCTTLLDCGYLVRTSFSSYRLGPKLLVLGKVYERTNTLVSISRPIMEELAAASGESAALFALEGERSICLAREYGPSRLFFAINEGDFMELYATATGRVLLAHAPADFRNRVLGSKLEAITPATITDAAWLKGECRAILERGYSLSREEREPGVAAIAAPVFDFEKKVPAVLSLVGPVQRFSEENLPGMIEKLLAATGDISRLMGEAR